MNADIVTLVAQCGYVRPGKCLGRHGELRQQVADAQDARLSGLGLLSGSHREVAGAQVTTVLPLIPRITPISVAEKKKF